MARKLSQILMAIVFIIGTFTGQIYAQYRGSLTPENMMKKWKSYNQFGLECQKSTDKLAKRLSETEDCSMWENLWIAEMDCAVKNNLTPVNIGYCWEYQNRPEKAKIFYQKIQSKYSTAICSYGGPEYDPISCSEVVKDLISEAPVDFSKFPTDPQELLDKMVNLLHQGKTREISSLFLDKNPVLYHEWDYPYTDLKNILDNYSPKQFKVGHSGFPEKDPSADKDTILLPCIKCSLLEKDGAINEICFQIVATPPRNNQPTRYYFDLTWGICKEQSNSLKK